MNSRYTIIKQLLILIVIQSTFLCCEQKTHQMNINDIKLFQAGIKYPYTASVKRVKEILKNMNALKKGMDKKQVIELLTVPDEVNLTYSLIKSKSLDRANGFSLVYILRRNKETGNSNEKNEKLLRIHFDDTGKLSWAYSIDIENFNSIEKD